MSAFSSAIETAEALASAALAEGDRARALHALEALKGAAATLDNRGEQLAIRVLGSVLRGRPDRARELLVGPAGHPAELLASLDRLNAEELDKIDAEADWEAVWAAVGSATWRGLQLAIPLVLGAVGANSE